MCGIFAILNRSPFTDQNSEYIKEQFMKGHNRGPESSVFTQINASTILGFHRLAINGLDSISNQPICIGDITLICNGEIYNYMELYRMLNITPTTHSDCEVIIHLYKRFGIEYTLQVLDGVFSFILLEQDIHRDDSRIYVARDPYGVRPLYYLKPADIKLSDSNPFGFASEMKQLINLAISLNVQTDHKYTVAHFEPGTYSEYTLSYKVLSSWKSAITNRRYHTTGFPTLFAGIDDPDAYIIGIQQYLISAVQKRCFTTERPIACLLSGGLDSSIITALVNEYVVKNNLPQLETYSIGIAGSPDLKYAKVVADYLGTRHTEVVLSEADFCHAIPEVIRAIESFDTTTVRASIGNYLLGKYIRANSQAKVIFNGDGSDELFGGYLYMQYSPDAVEFDCETRRLLKDIHQFDVLRSDKSISSHGLEPRTPFLDRAFTQYVLSIHPKLRHNPFLKGGQYQEKWLLRKAFDIEYYSNSKGVSLLPEEVLYRRKEAFSDGVSGSSRSLYQVLQEHTEKQWFEGDYLKLPATNNQYEVALHIVDELKEVGGHLIPKTTEQYYYRKMFETAYPGCGKVVPYFWMPKYVEAKDASARTLSIY